MLFLLIQVHSFLITNLAVVISYNCTCCNIIPHAIFLIHVHYFLITNLAVEISLIVHAVIKSHMLFFLYMYILS